MYTLKRLIRSRISTHNQIQMVNFYQRNTNKIELCLIILALLSVLLYMLGLLDVYKKNELEEIYIDIFHLLLIVYS